MKNKYTFEFEKPDGILTKKEKWINFLLTTKIVLIMVFHVLTVGLFLSFWKIEKKDNKDKSNG